MTVLHAFVDESSRRNDYLMCATTVSTTELAEVRRAMRRLPARGQRRIHFATESDSRRRSLLGELAQLGVSTTIYVAESKDQVAAREAILRQMVPELRNLGVRLLVLDSREGQDHRDRSTIRQTVGGDPRPEFRYDHQPSASEPLLWVPDAVAWAWGRGGEWRRLIEASGLIAAVTTVEVP